MEGLVELSRVEPEEPLATLKEAHERVVGYRELTVP